MRVIFSLVSLVVIAAIVLWLAKTQFSAVRSAPKPPATVQGVIVPTGSPDEVKKKVEAEVQKTMDEQAKRLEQADK
jgi:ABC-type phosphate/phosphonate transport system substrate-binding protein